VQRIKKQLVDYMLVKEKLIQSLRYKTLAVIKSHKRHLSLSFIKRYTFLIFEYLTILRESNKTDRLTECVQNLSHKHGRRQRGGGGRGSRWFPPRRGK